MMPCYSIVWKIALHWKITEWGGVLCKISKGVIEKGVCCCFIKQYLCKKGLCN